MARLIMATPEGIPAESQADVQEGFQRGEVAIFPTETLYGLGGDPGDAGVVGRIYDLKGRPQGQPLPVLAADAAAAGALFMPGHQAERELWDALTSAFWPGPLTLVVPAAAGPAAGVVAADGSIAVRVPGLPVARQLARLCGGSLVATSANRSGQEPPATAAAAVRSLGDDVDMLVDAGATTGGLPSTLLSLLHGEIRLLRVGAVSVERITSALGVAPEA